VAPNSKINFGGYVQPGLPAHQSRTPFPLRARLTPARALVNLSALERQQRSSANRAFIRTGTTATLQRELAHSSAPERQQRSGREPWIERDVRIQPFCGAWNVPLRVCSDSLHLARTTDFRCAESATNCRR